MNPSVHLVTRQVTASAEIRSVVSAAMIERHVVAVSVPAGRGPSGRDGADGDQGPPGPPGQVGDNAILDGGNF